MKSSSNLVFVSISDVAGGAENILLMSAIASESSMLFLKQEKQGCLNIPDSIPNNFASKRSVFLGLVLLPYHLHSYRKNYTVISTHPYLNAYLGLLKRLGYLKSKLVVRECTSVFTRYSGWKRLSYQIAYRLGYQGADRIICQTEVMKSEFLKHNQYIHSQQVVVQGNPINQKQILQDSEISTIDLTDYGRYICVAGRLIPEKGFDIMLYAFETLQKNNPGLRLIILGEGPQREKLSQLIFSLGLTESVELKGWVKNPMPYFKSATVCVISSIKEGFPNALLQMMLLNPAVVSTCCAGGIAEIPGLKTVPVNNPFALSTAIQDLLNEDNKQFLVQTSAYLENRTPETFVASIIDAL